MDELSKHDEVRTEVKIAVLEVKMADVKQSVTDLRNETKKDISDLNTAMHEGFKDVNTTLKELKERDNVSEFFQKNWKVVTIVVAMAVGGNGWEIAKALITSMGGH